MLLSGTISPRFVSPNASARFRRLRSPRRAYSLIEMLITILIIQIISSFALLNVSTIQSSERLTRAAEQVVLALRYSRMLAMSTGQSCGVSFDTSANTATVFQGNTSTAASNSMMPNGTYILNFSTSSELSGVKISSAMISNASSNPYAVTYGTLGGTVNNGYITLSIGNQTRTVQIPLVGDPTVQ